MAMRFEGKCALVTGAGKGIGREIALLLGQMAWGDPAKSDPMKAKIPLRRFAAPIEVAQAVAFLLSDEAAMIHGVTLPVDGGFLATR